MWYVRIYILYALKCLQEETFAVLTVWKAIRKRFKSMNTLSKCCKIVKMDAEHRQQLMSNPNNAPCSIVVLVSDKGASVDDASLDVS